MSELDVVQQKDIAWLVSHVDLVLRIQLSKLEVLFLREVFSVAPHRGEGSFMRRVGVELVQELEVGVVSTVNRVYEVELTFVVVNGWSANASAKPVLSVELVVDLLSFQDLNHFLLCVDAVGVLPLVVPLLFFP